MAAHLRSSMLLTVTQIALVSFSAEKDCDPALPAPAPRHNTTAGYIGDRNTRAGQSDNFGDYKGFSFVDRTTDGLVFAGKAEILTPQKDSRGKQFDTAAAFLTMGKENQDCGVYGLAGFINGRALRVMQYDVVDALHRTEGMGPSRKSPASSPAKVMLGVAARRDWEIKRTDFGPVRFGLRGAAFGEISTLRTAAGVGAFATAGSKTHGDFKPDLPGPPMAEVRGSTVYAGVTAQGVVSSIATDRLGTNHLQTGVAAGATWRFNRVALSVGVDKPLSSPVVGSPYRAIAYVGTRLNIRI